MPYKIRKMPGKQEWKVYGPSGALSNKGLSRKQAEKQKIAVQISEARQKKIK